MSKADLINGEFEASAGILIWLNVYRIWKDKEVKGVSLAAQALFTLWGWWNLYYYPSLSQWASFWGGVLVVVGNTAWMSLALRYRRRP